MRLAQSPPPMPITCPSPASSSSFQWLLLVAAPRGALCGPVPLPQETFAVHPKGKRSPYNFQLPHGRLAKGLYLGKAVSLSWERQEGGTLCITLSFHVADHFAPRQDSSSLPMKSPSPPWRRLGEGRAEAPRLHFLLPQERP